MSLMRDIYSGNSKGVLINTCIDDLYQYTMLLIGIVCPLNQKHGIMHTLLLFASEMYISMFVSDGILVNIPSILQGLS